MHEIYLSYKLQCFTIQHLMPSTFNTRYEGQGHIFATAIIY